MERKEYTLILHNVRSAHNVGAIFRTADAAGINKIYLTGYTPAPVDRFGKPRPDIAKTALGAETAIFWEYRKTLAPVLRLLRKEHTSLIAIEQSPRSEDYKKVKVPPRAAFIVGNEVRGLSPRLLAQCDIVAEIPMRGKKNRSMFQLPQVLHCSAFLVYRNIFFFIARSFTIRQTSTAVDVCLKDLKYFFRERNYFANFQEG